jgi:hypothetical protein
VPSSTGVETDEARRSKQAGSSHRSALSIEVTKLPAHRHPAGSGPLTAPFAARVPAQWRQPLVVIINAIHTAIFFSIAGLVVLNARAVRSNARP